jgi:spermidine/putrescine-binding protein
VNLNKKISLITLPVISYASILPLTSCSANGKIVFANYESYFSTDLTRKYQNEVNFLYYQTDGDIRAKFRKSYDIAVPTTAEALRYIKDG